MPKPRKRRSPKSEVPTYLRHKSGGRDRAFCYVVEDSARRRVYLRQVVRSGGVTPRGQGIGVFTDHAVEKIVEWFLGVHETFKR